VVDSLKKLLNNLGIDELEDLNFLKEDDLISALKKVHARKLIAHWQSTLGNAARSVKSSLNLQIVVFCLCL
jgi:hypothetical protein